MTINEHLRELAGRPVVEFQHGRAGKPGGEVAWRIAASFDGPVFEEVLRAFLDEVATAGVTHLVVGYWGASYDTHGAVDPVGLLVEAAGRLPGLRALFLGDIVMEEAEISWIEHADVSRLFDAFPHLEHLEVRGSNGLRLRPVRSRVLRTLRFESGGLPAAVVRAVGDSDLPALEHLDLWLGTDEYGGDTTEADLAGILGGERLPALRHLGLEDAEIADAVAGALAGAPIVARLESLSLAMGALTDDGAAALLSGQPLAHLRRLDLHHHYLTDAGMNRLRIALPGVSVNLDEQESPDDEYRYVAVSE